MAGIPAQGVSKLSSTNTDFTRRNSHSASRLQSSQHPGTTKSSRTLSTAPVASRHAPQAPSKRPHTISPTEPPCITYNPVGYHSSSDNQTLSPSAPPQHPVKRHSKLSSQLHPSPCEAQGCPATPAGETQQPTSCALVQLPVWSKALGL